MADKVIFGENAARQIGETVRAEARRLRNPGAGHRGRSGVNPVEIVQGYLQAGLEAAVDPYNAPTAELRVHHRDVSGDLADSGYSVTVTNRYTDFSLGQGDYMIAQWMGAEWAPQAGGRGAPIVMFTIGESNYCQECSVRALVFATSAPVGTLPAANGDPYDPDADPDSYSGQYWITVYDKTFPQSCFFNEPPEDLEGRTGFAVYLDCLTDGPCASTFGPRWVVFSLCCKIEGCAD